MYNSILNGLECIHFDDSSITDMLISCYNSCLFQLLLDYTGDDTQLFDVQYRVIKAICRLPFVHDIPYESISIMHSFFHQIVNQICTGEPIRTPNFDDIADFIHPEGGKRYLMPRICQHVLFAEIHGVDFLHPLPGFEHRFLSDGSVAELFQDDYMCKKVDHIPGPEDGVTALVSVQVDLVNLIECRLDSGMDTQRDRIQYLAANYDENTPNYMGFRVTIQQSFNVGSIITAMDRGRNTERLGKIDISTARVVHNMVLGLPQNISTMLRRDFDELDDKIEECRCLISQYEINRDIAGTQITSDLNTIESNPSHTQNGINELLHWKITENEKKMKELSRDIARVKCEMGNYVEEKEKLISSWSGVCETIHVMIPEIHGMTEEEEEGDKFPRSYSPFIVRGSDLNDRMSGPDKDYHFSVVSINYFYDHTCPFHASLVPSFAPFHVEDINHNPNVVISHGRIHKNGFEKNAKAISYESVLSKYVDDNQLIYDDSMINGPTLPFNGVSLYAISRLNKDYGQFIFRKKVCYDNILIGIENMCRELLIVCNMACKRLFFVHQLTSISVIHLTEFIMEVLELTGRYTSTIITGEVAADIMRELDSVIGPIMVITPDPEGLMYVLVDSNKYLDQNEYRKQSLEGLRLGKDIRSRVLFDGGDLGVRGICDREERIGTYSDYEKYLDSHISLRGRDQPMVPHSLMSTPGVLYPISTSHRYGLPGGIGGDESIIFGVTPISAPSLDENDLTSTLFSSSPSIPASEMHIQLPDLIEVTEESSSNHNHHQVIPPAPDPSNNADSMDIDFDDWEEEIESNSPSIIDELDSTN